MAKADQYESPSPVHTEKSVQSVLITLPRPETDKSPYFDLAKKYQFEVDFHPFIRVEGVPGKEFRKQRIDITQYTAVVFSSRSAIDHFFRIGEELKVKVSQDMKYFCISEAVALYLQKFILYRKRKVFFSADGSPAGLIEVIGKHKSSERFIVPSSDNGRNEVAVYMQENQIDHVEATLYRTLSNEIAGIMEKTYDLIVFFSPFSVQTLLDQIPDYKQEDTLMAAFGPATSKAVEEAGLRLDLRAPAPNAPSMASAIDLFLSGESVK